MLQCQPSCASACHETACGSKLVRWQLSSVILCVSNRPSMRNHAEKQKMTCHADYHHLLCLPCRHAQSAHQVVTKQLTRTLAVLLKRSWSTEDATAHRAFFDSLETQVAASGTAAARRINLEVLEVKAQSCILGHAGCMRARHAACACIQSCWVLKPLNRAAAYSTACEPVIMWALRQAMALRILARNALGYGHVKEQQLMVHAGMHCADRGRRVYAAQFCQQAPSWHAAI